MLLNFVGFGHKVNDELITMSTVSAMPELSNYQDIERN